MADNTDFTIKRVGSVGRIEGDVSLADEDLRMLVDLAERNRVPEITVQNLSPSVTISVDNNNGEPLTEQAVANMLKNVLIEQVNSHGHVYYS